MRSELVLLVEDNGPEALQYENSLRNHGFNVAKCHDASCAIKEINERKTISAIVLDIMLPTGGAFSSEETSAGRKTGIVLYSRIRMLLRKVPIVAYSLDRGVVEELRRTGRKDEYLSVHPKLSPSQLAVVVKGVVSQPAFGIKEKTAFMMMAMNEPSSQLFTDDVVEAYRKTLKPFGIRLVHPNDLNAGDRIAEAVKEEIRNADLLIADISFEKPNVYYEIGFAHALTKKVLLFGRRKGKTHFHLTQYKVERYSDLRKLKTALERTLKQEGLRKLKKTK